MNMDGIIAGELLSIARELDAAARPNIARMFRTFNSRYFDSKIPNIQVKWARSKVWAGRCTATWNKRTREGTVKSIKISTYIEGAGQEVIEQVMLHEMVHAYTFVTGKYDGHGFWFNHLRKEFSQKTGIHIPRFEKLEHFAVPEEVKTKPMGVVVFRGKKGFMTYNWAAFNRSFSQIIERLEWGADKRNLDVSLFKIEDRDLMLYPESRKFKFQWIPDKTGIINTIFNKGKELARVTSGEPTEVFAPA
jgi:hypothetical protein